MEESKDHGKTQQIWIMHHFEDQLDKTIAICYHPWLATYKKWKLQSAIWNLHVQ